MKNFKLRNLILAICILLSVMLVVCSCTGNDPEESDESISESTEETNDNADESDDESSEESDPVDENTVIYTFIITNTAGEPVANASVNLCVGEDSCLMPQFTNENGVATVIGDKGIVYDLKVFCDGYATATGTVSEDTTEYEITILAPEGSEENPKIVDFAWSEDSSYASATVTVAAGETVYFSSYGNIGGMLLSINNGEPTVLKGSMMNPPVFSITNDTDADAEYTIALSYPIGSYMNPEAIFTAANIAVNVPAGNDQGYYYSWYPMTAGTLVLTCPTVEGVEYDVILINKNSYAQSWLSDSEDNTVAIDFEGADQIVIQIVTSPDGNWSYPALETTFTGEFLAPAGSRENPVVIDSIETVAVTVDEGNNQGYYLAWTADKNGILNITCPTVEGVEYDVVITNMNNCQSVYLVDSQDGTLNITLTEGDQIVIQINPIPDDNWNYPALTVTLTGTFTAA